MCLAIYGSLFLSTLAATLEANKPNNHGKTRYTTTYYVLLQQVLMLYSFQEAKSGGIVLSLRAHERSSFYLVAEM